VNPFGHLQIWSGLLRNGGEVLMVIPDYIGSKDYLADPTGLDEILAEYHAGQFAPSAHHYKRYAKARSSPDKATGFRMPTHPSTCIITRTTICALYSNWPSETDIPRSIRSLQRERQGLSRNRR
jgi:hypothetical protein